MTTGLVPRPLVILLALQTALHESTDLAPDADEQALVEAARRLEDGAWQTLYERHYPRLYSYLYYRVGDAEGAEDLTAEVFERAVRGIGRYQQRGSSLGAWLMRIARNLAHDHYRRQKVRPPDPLELNEAWFRGGDDPAHRAVHNESSRLLRQALERLTPEQRDVILLRFVARMTGPEIARSMGKTAGAVKAIQHRGLASLRRELEALGYHGLV